VIPENFITDKNGTEYKNGIKLPLEIISGNNYNDLPKDAKIPAALKGLNEQH